MRQTDGKSGLVRTAVVSAVAGIIIGAGCTVAVLRTEGYPIGVHPVPAAFAKLYRVYNDIENGYYRSVSSNSLVDGAISGMTNVLNDPFTDYFDPQQAQQFQAMLSSSMVGIGVQIAEKSGLPHIVSVFSNSPAAKAGIRTGDIILKVDGTSTQGLSLNTVASHMQGAKGTVRVLTLRRGKQTLTKRVTLSQVEIPSVTSRILDENIGYIAVSVMASDTATQLQQQLSQLEKQGATSLVLDLRGNPGGYLSQAVQVAGLFLPKNDVVVKTQGRNGATQVLRSPGPGNRMPLVVLINQDTASAAEILAASLHQDRAITLVGTRSFGKGTAQVTDTFTDGSELKYTVEKWLTPNGTWINKKGIQPQVEVQLNANAVMGDEVSDNQLQAAVKWLQSHP